MKKHNLWTGILSAVFSFLASLFGSLKIAPKAKVQEDNELCEEPDSDFPSDSPSED